MLAVIATIGKIILIIILSILIVLLALLGFLLFVPLRYKGNGKFNAYEKPNFHCDFRVSWFLHLISLRFYSLEDENVFLLKIFGIKHTSYQKFFAFFQRKKAKKNSDLIKDEENLKEEDCTNQTESEIKEKVIIEETITNREEKSDSEEQFCATNQTDQENGSNEGDESYKEDGLNGKDKSDKDKKTKFSFGKIKQLLRDGEKLKKKIGRFYKILSSDLCKEAFSACKERLFKLIKYILPHKSKLNLYFGFDDPSVTANILAIHGILYALLSDIIILHPNFDDVMFYGDFKLKGKIRLCTILYHVLRIYFDQNCKRFYRIIKKEMNHGR